LKLTADRSMVADFGSNLGHTLGMSFEPLTLQEKLAAEYHARWEAVEIAKAHELAALTDQEALAVIRSLRLFAPAPPNPANGMGLVEQQAVFHRHQR
jgi:hypothetical protein